MAATLKLLPLFTLVMPGMAARVLFKNEVKTFLKLIISYIPQVILLINNLPICSIIE